MSEGWIVGRKDIIRALKIPLALSEDGETAWNKIRRWRKRYRMDELFHHLPSGSVYLVKDEVEVWLQRKGSR